MLDRYFHRDRVRRRIEANVLGDELAALAAWLSGRGHPRSSIQRYLQAAEHFGCWLSKRGMAAHDVNLRSVEDFLTRHLRSCRCPVPAPRNLKTVRAALHHLIRMVAGESASSSPVDRSAGRVELLLHDFGVHLRTVRGLAPATCRYRQRYAREFLANSPMDQRDELSPQAVVRFVAGYARRCSPATAQVVASSLRSLLRFLRLRGLIGKDLAAAVPRVAHWRLSSLPVGLSETELGQLVRACHGADPVRRRDLGVLRCMTDLGLRAHEVADLRIEDIDWRRPALRVGAGKARRWRLVPLPHCLAEALAEYLRHGRPPTTTRHLFVQHRAPRGAAMAPGGIASVVRRAAARAGLTDRCIGTHLLRHTVAGRLLQRGVAMKEIADLLGHRSIDTTAIYAKVDLPGLAAVGMPWPEAKP